MKNHFSKIFSDQQISKKKYIVIGDKMSSCFLEISVFYKLKTHFFLLFYVCIYLHIVHFLFGRLQEILNARQLDSMILERINGRL